MRRFILLTFLAFLTLLFPRSASAEDADGDGWQAGEAPDQDCNDNDPAIYPAAQEVCNGIDDDCDKVVDQGMYALDGDGDGYGDNISVDYGDVCALPAGYVASITDCNDRDPTIHPGATEVCNNVDDNCNGVRDDLTFYRDVDRDAFGGAQSTTVKSCEAPDGYVSPRGDCDDGDATVYPGADEICDGKDNDCNGVADDAEEWRCPDPTPTPPPPDETESSDETSPDDDESTEETGSSDETPPSDGESTDDPGDDGDSDGNPDTASGSQGTLPELPPSVENGWGCSTGGLASTGLLPPFVFLFLLFLPTSRRRHA